MDKSYINKLMSNFINTRNEFTFDDVVNMIGEYTVCTQNIINLINENLENLENEGIIIKKNSKYIYKNKSQNIDLNISCDIKVVNEIDNVLKLILLNKTEKDCTINIKYNLQETNLTVTKNNIKKLISFLKQCI